MAGRSFTYTERACGSMRAGGTRRLRFDILPSLMAAVRNNYRPPQEWLHPMIMIPPNVHPPHVKKRWPPLVRDKLKKIWFERHPEGRKITMVATEVGYEKYWHHPAASFIWRQMRLMKQGHSQEEAYNIVEEQDRKAREYRQMERKLAIEHLEDFGAREIETAEKILKPSVFDHKPTEMMLEEVIDLRKKRGMRNPLTPRELPKGVSFYELRKLLEKRPDLAHYVDIMELGPLYVAQSNGSIPISRFAMERRFQEFMAERKKVLEKRLRDKQLREMLEAQNSTAEGAEASDVTTDEPTTPLSEEELQYRMGLHEKLEQEEDQEEVWLDDKRPFGVRLEEYMAWQRGEVELEDVGADSGDEFILPKQWGAEGRGGVPDQYRWKAFVVQNNLGLVTRTHGLPVDDPALAGEQYLQEGGAARREKGEGAMVDDEEDLDPEERAEERLQHEAFHDSFKSAVKNAQPPVWDKLLLLLERAETDPIINRERYSKIRGKGPAAAAAAAPAKQP